MRYAFCVARRTGFFLIFLIMASCASKGTAPVVQRPAEGTGKRNSVSDTRQVTATAAEQRLRIENKQGFHIVKKGDTLYSIAWNYGFDYREVAGWNNIHEPYLIYPGQVVRLKPAPESRTPALQPGPVVDKSPAEVDRDTSSQAVVRRPVTATPAAVKKPVTGETGIPADIINWHWPVQGKIIKSGTLTSKKGVDIGGRLGQDIKAAAQGDVVYSGSGLLGYGRLIIIKHNDTFLSAYAYNSELLVKEGDYVSTGQAIAKMGKSSSGQALLHFEIRKNGKSVNPLKLLPKS